MARPNAQISPFILARGEGQAGPAGAGEDNPKLLHVRDEKASGTSGGTATVGSWVKRDLNTVLTNDITGASLATSQITLPAGTYMINASASGYRVDSHRIRLRDTTGAADLLLGTTEHSNNTTATQSRALLRGRFTLAVESVLEIQHRVSATTSANDFGPAASFGVVEVYADVRIEKLP